MIIEVGGIKEMEVIRAEGDPGQISTMERNKNGGNQQQKIGTIK